MDALTKAIYDEVSKIIHPVYLVGGSVRDVLLSKPPKDYDFCTPLNPDQIEELVRKAGRKPFITGKRFGTIGFKVLVDKIPYMVEVTTFRTESYEEGNRKPTVEFVNDITHDLSRRDFTINSMAWRNGNLIDPFGGQKDLTDGVLKAVGRARTRFKEDPLRMLRAARFASQLSFKVDLKTQKDMTERAHSILTVSKERWMAELDKLLMSRSPAHGLDLLMDTRVMNFIIPELSIQKGYNQNSKYHRFDLWTHTKLVVEKAPNTIECKWAALLHDIAKPFVRTEDWKDSSEDLAPEHINRVMMDDDSFGYGVAHYIKHDFLGAEMVDKTALYLKWSNDRHKQVRELVLNHLKDDCPIREADKLGH